METDALPPSAPEPDCAFRSEEPFIDYNGSGLVEFELRGGTDLSFPVTSWSPAVQSGQVETGCSVDALQETSVIEDHSAGGKSGGDQDISTTTSEQEKSVWTIPLQQVAAQKSSSRGQVEANDLMELLDEGKASKTSHTMKRIVYSGETMTHAILPHLTGHRSFLSPGSRPPSEGQPAVSQAPCVTLRASLKPDLSWSRRRIMQHVDVFTHLPPEDITYLTEVKNCLLFPPKPAVDSLFDAFIRHFLPAFPVLDRTELQILYDELGACHVSSPLLLHAILFDGCQYAPLSTIKACGFSGRLVARQYFHKQARLLYLFDCEKDQLRLLQSLILMSPWWTDYAEEKETRFWITCACNLAFSMGLHKAVPKPSTLSSNTRSLWRRVFWTLFVSDGEP